MKAASWGKLSAEDKDPKGMDQPHYSYNPNTPPMRRDTLSPWSLVLIVLFFINQGLTMAGWTPTWMRHKGVAKYAPVSRSALTSETDFKRLAALDQTAKVVYISEHMAHTLGGGTPAPFSLLSPRTLVISPLSPPTGRSLLFPSRKRKKPLTLKDVATTAVDALRHSPSDVDFARRVILLRAETGSAPLAPIAPKGRLQGLASPLLAYAPSPGMSSKQKAALSQEAALWKELFSTPKLAKGTNVAPIVSQIGKLRALRWYRYLALRQAYLRAGDAAMAARLQGDAVERALLSVIPLVVIILGVLALVFGSVLLFIIVVIATLVVRARGGAVPGQTPGMAEWLARLGRPRNPPLAAQDRRLGAGDLMDVFVFYLVSGLAIGFVFQWLAGPFHKWIATLSYDSTINVLVCVEAVAYIVNGLLAVWLLWAIARRRGAKLWAEIGLTTDRLGRNILFGVAGWAVGYAAMIGIESVSDRVFRGAPEPTNPAVWLEVSSSGLASRLTLFLLASVAAPFFEEVLFRGVFFQAARLRVGAWPAIVLTGLVFGFAHPVGVAEAVVLASLGAVFAGMAYLRQSLVPSMTSHFLQNTFASVVMWLIFMVLLPQ